MKDGQAEKDIEEVIRMTNKNNIKKEQVRKKKLTKKEKQRMKRIKRIKFFLRLIVSVGLIVGAIVFALTSPIFNIKEIKVVNNNKVQNDTVISLSELKTEENIFKFTKTATIKKIRENPYIENVKIRRHIPSTVEIEIEERIAKYSVDYMGKYVLISTQGYLLEISQDGQNLPIIQGVTTNEDEIQLGKRLNNEDLERLGDVIKIVNSANENGLEGKITSIDISNKNEYSIYLKEEKKRIHLGNNTNLSNKMLNAVAIMEKEKENEGDIYVNGDLNNKFKPYFKQKV